MGLEQLWRGQLRGPLLTKAASATNQWAGRTSIASGDATAVVSTTLVNSDSIILLGCESATRQSSGLGQPIEVSCISPGNWFELSTSDGEALARNTTVHWVLIKTS